MRLLRVAAALVLLVALPAAAAVVADRSVRRTQDEGTPAGRPVSELVIVVAMPAVEARWFLDNAARLLGRADIEAGGSRVSTGSGPPEAGASSALGVYPPSRKGVDFWRAVSAGAPVRVAGRPSPLGGRRCRVGEALNAAGRGYSVVRMSNAGPREVLALRDALCPTQSASRPLSDQQAIAAGTAEEAAKGVALAGGARGETVIVLGTSPRTPVIVGIVLPARSGGILAGGVARRRGVSTPYDVSRLLLERNGVRVPRGVIGRPLRVVEPPPGRSGPGTLAGLAGRLERDAGIGPGTAAAAISVLLGGGIVLTLLLVAAGARRLALRTARGGAAGVAGYVGSLFVQSGDARLHAVPMVAAFAIGFALPSRGEPGSRRAIGWLLAGSSTAIAALTLAAALRPDAEPALSLWGDPLVSWRFFGLRNHLASMLALGVLAGPALLARRAAPAWALAAGIGGAIVVGSPSLGANFVAVLWLVFGATAAAVVLARGRLGIGGAVMSAVAGAVAFAGALMADAGSPASHGGQAVERVRAGGLEAARAFLDVRLRLNIEEIRGLWGGVVYALLLFAGLVAILVWASRDDRLPRGPRAVMAGGSLAALAALVLEDTGFLAGGIAALAPGLVALQSLAARLGFRGEPEAAVLGPPPAATTLGPPPGAGDG